mmetsp:Transcript_7750/g.23692  ORF Transcript_7750/g.23692 Transcript_7750/m.23692 type:complete len:207 (-) Transcript_7750:247-867(-)
MSTALRAPPSRNSSRPPCQRSSMRAQPLSTSVVVPREPGGTSSSSPTSASALASSSRSLAAFARSAASSTALDTAAPLERRQSGLCSCHAALWQSRPQYRTALHPPHRSVLRWRTPQRAHSPASPLRFGGMSMRCHSPSSCTSQHASTSWPGISPRSSSKHTAYASTRSSLISSTVPPGRKASMRATRPVRPPPNDSSCASRAPEG